MNNEQKIEKIDEVISCLKMAKECFQLSKSDDDPYEDFAGFCISSARVHFLKMQQE